MLYKAFKFFLDYCKNEFKLRLKCRFAVFTLNDCYVDQGGCIFNFKKSQRTMIELLKNLIDIPSVTGQETEIGEFLFHLLIKKGYDVQKQFVEDRRFNIIATRSNPAKILLCTHIDTVGAFIPFRQVGDTIYGRGSCDAKGSIASMLTTGDKLSTEGIKNFGLLFVVGEELKSDGALNAAKLAVGSKYIVLGEPSNNKLVIAQKGTLVFRITVKGKAAHSAFPEKGVSAIHNLIKILNEWQNTDWGHNPALGDNTLNIGKISGGVNMNTIADHAEATGIFRIATGLSPVKTKLHTYENDMTTIEVICSSEPTKLTPLNGFETVTVPWGTDAPYLMPLGEVFLIGPGSIDDAHTANERITISELEKSVKIYIDIVKQML